ncbi:MAG: GumC family protein, partial [Acidobacteriota bacterium]|nr:GumC family protein [Acidobacteriota bacterium]
MAEQEKQRELNIREYLQILSRRRWIIYTCVLVATVAATAASFIATPIYRSTGTIKIERAGIRILRQDLTSAQPSWLDYQNFYNTQYRIIGSDRVLRQAVEQLDLVNRPGLFGKDGSSLSISLNKWKSSLIRTISRSRAPLASEQDELAPYIKLIRGGLSVEPVRESFLVEISYISPDPELAAEVANAVADAYRYFTLSEKMDVATQSTDWFVEQIVSLKSDVGALQNELQEYSRRHRIVLGQEGAVSRQNFVDLRQKFSQAQASTTAKHAALDKVRRSPAESLDEVRANTLIRDLTRQLTDLRSRHDELRTTFGADYPEVRTISTKIDSQTQLLEDETQKIAQTVLAGAVADYQESLQQEKYLAQLLDRVQSEVEKEDRAMGEYQTKRSELEQKRGTLEDLMTRQNEMNLSAALGDTAHNVRTIDFAEVPTQIFRPKKKLNIMIGLLFGLFLGVAASVLMEFIDNTLKTPDDVRAILGVPVLGLIPSQEALSRSNRRKRKRSGRGDAEDLEPALISAKVPLSPIAEAYRELRTALLLATPGHPPRDLSVTSC